MKNEEHDGPRILIYGHDTYGLGHLRRNLAMATSLTRAMPAASILLITGSPSAGAFRMPDTVDFVKLPAVIKVASEEYESKSLRMSATDIIAMRSSLIRETTAAFQPDLVIIDHAPLGMKGELLPTLTMLRKDYPRTKIVLGLRDVLDDPERVYKTWQEQQIPQYLERFYDVIMVYGLPEIVDIGTAYQLPAALCKKIQYCGYIPRDQSTQQSLIIRQQLCSQQEKLILVTIGGGGDGAHILQTYLAAMQLPAAPKDIISVLVTGPYIAESDRAAIIEANAGLDAKKFHVLEFTDDLMAYIEAADLVISMGGHNTICEIFSADRPSICIPRTEPRKEQLIRAIAFAKSGLLHMIHPQLLTPEIVVRMLKRVLFESPYRPSQRNPALYRRLLNGTERSIAILQKVLATTVDRQCNDNTALQKIRDETEVYL